MLGYGALLALALRHAWYEAGALFWAALVILLMVAWLIYGYARERNLMDIAREDLIKPRAVRAKLFIALAVLLLAIIFAVLHVRTLMVLWGK